jgi:type IV pilus assembly protein PilN
MRINLLPHREMRREHRRKEFLRVILVTAFAGIALVVLIAAGIEARIAAQRDRNAFIERENRELDGQIREISQLRQEIESLRARQLAVENLQRERALPVHLLDDLVRYTPDGVYFRQLRQTERRIFLVGMAESNERISYVLGALAREAPHLERPELVEIKSVVLAKPQKDKPARRAFEFSVHSTLKSLGPEEPKAAGASVPRPAGAPGATR